MFCNDLWALAFSSDIHRARRLNRTRIWQNRALLQQEITQNRQKETFPSLPHKTRSRHLLISPSTKSKKLQTLVHELKFIHILARKEDAQTLDYANEETPQHRITWIKLRKLHLHCQSWETLLAYATYTRMERNTYIFWFCFKSSETRIASDLKPDCFEKWYATWKKKHGGDLYWETQRATSRGVYHESSIFFEQTSGRRSSSDKQQPTAPPDSAAAPRELASKEHGYGLRRPVVWKQQK
jgi:hypothetical protein